MNKKNIAILFGGQSAEHEISVISAKNIFNAIDAEKYNPILIGVSRSGCFYHFEDAAIFRAITNVDDSRPELLTHFIKHIDKTTTKNNIKIDCVFCIIHGQSGEDGIMPGLCEAYNLPYVGSNVVSSGLCMDKVFTKIIAQKHHIKTANFINFTENHDLGYESYVEKFGKVFFMKIANLGSSIGVYKIKSFEDYQNALSKIWRFGDKVMIEEFVENAREIEVAIFSDDKNLITSDVLGEIKPNHEFYSYEAKYLDPNGAELIVPAKLDQPTIDKIKEYATTMYKALDCYGLARVDFLVNEKGVYFNEINTLPGFTNISMYPKLFQESGISYKKLISMLIESAFSRNVRDISGLMRD